MVVIEDVRETVVSRPAMESRVIEGTSHYRGNKTDSEVGFTANRQ